MKNPPYSLVEAEKIASDHQFLAGRSFRREGDVSIECVTVAPFDENNRKRFIIYYLLFNDPKIALEHDYKGLLFDVLVISSSPDKQGLEHESLAVWLANNESDTLSGFVAESISPAASMNI